MEDISNISMEAIRRYFNTLSKFGYKSYDEVDKLIALLAIEEILLGELSYFITETDYRSIVDFLYCIFGSTCLADMPGYITYDSLIHPISADKKYRITENNILRISEDSYLRIEA